MTNPSSKTVGERPKVKRYNFNAGIGATEHPEGVLVKSSEYDAKAAELVTAVEDAQCYADIAKDLRQRLNAVEASNASLVDQLSQANRDLDFASERLVQMAKDNASLVERVGKAEALLREFEYSTLFQPAIPSEGSYAKRIHEFLTPAEEKKA